MTIAHLPDVAVPAPRAGLLSAQKLVLPFTLPGANEILRARGQRNGRTNEYALWKARVQPTIAALAKKQLQPVKPGGVWLRFTWYEADRSRDPLDVRWASKLIVDALCEYDRDFDPQARAGILHCDGWHCVQGGSDFFAVDAERARIEVVLYGVRR